MPEKFEVEARGVFKGKAFVEKKEGNTKKQLKEMVREVIEEKEDPEKEEGAKETPNEAVEKTPEIPEQTEEKVPPERNNPNKQRKNLFRPANK